MKSGHDQTADKSSRASAVGTGLGAADLTRRQLLIGGGMGALALGLASCSSGAVAGGAKSSGGAIKIVNPSGVSITPYYHALDKKLFQKAGLKVNPILRNTGGDVIQVFTSGGADIAITGPGPIGVTIGKGVPARLLAYIAYGAVQVLTVDPSIQGVSDLKGKVLAVSSIGSASEVIGRMMIAQSGLDTHKDTQVRPMPGPEMVTSALQGQIDAAILWEPFTAAIVHEKPDARLLLDSVKDWPRLFNSPNPNPWHGMMAKTDFLDSRADDAETILSILGQGAKAVEGNYAEQARLLEKYEHMKPDTALAAAKAKSVVFNPTGKLPSADRKATMTILDQMQKWGYMKGTLKPSGVFWTKAQE